MNITCLLFGIVILIFGILFAAGRVHTCLKAWKHMPEEEKSKIYIKPLCLNIGAMIILCGVIFIIAGLSSAFKDGCFVWAMVVWIIIAFIDVRFISKSGRYTK